MSHDDAMLASHDVRLPQPILDAILGIADVPTALGELRCLTLPLIHGIEYRRRAGTYLGTDVVLEAYLSVVTRLAADHPMAVAGAIDAGSCTCDAGTGVAAAVRLVLESLPPRPVEDVSPGGMYL